MHSCFAWTNSGLSAGFMVLNSKNVCMTVNRCGNTYINLIAMAPSRFDHRRIILQVMDEGDIQGAIKKIVDMTSGDVPKKRLAVFQNIRAKILRNPIYQNPTALLELEAIAVGSPDRDRVLALAKLPVHNIHWAQTKKCFFADKVTQERFKQIRFMQEAFYEFDAPTELKVESAEAYGKEVMKNHMHKTRKVDDYHFTEDEIADMVNKASELIESDQKWTERTSSLKLLDCLSLVSGRRKWELCSTLKVKSVPDKEYQAMIRGIGKSSIHSLNSVEWYIIPLLIPIENFIRGIANLRKYSHVPGKYYYGNPIFPKMRHTCYRDIFSSWAYKHREVNQFLANESCSELGWRARSLCVSINTIGGHYSTLCIDNEPKPGDQDDGERQCPEQ